MEKKEVVVSAAPSRAPPSPLQPQGRLPTRLIVCVDGARYDANNPSETPTTIYRIYRSLRQGRIPVSDAQSDGVEKEIEQLPRYFSAISGSADEVFSRDKLSASLPGHGEERQIQDVYEACCRLRGSEDEVVFFGFARGAYVVRAVAGLLHHFGCLAGAGGPDFARGYKKVLKEVDKVMLRPELVKTNSLSSLSTIQSGDFRPPPLIRFVGAFDTVKGVSDDSALDISPNTSIQHLRHAVALHEDRKALQPEVLDFSQLTGELRKTGRSAVQAWFIGSHGDMGGSSPKSGLSLYPAQWIIFEAQTCGVRFDLGVKEVEVLFPKVAKKKAKDGEPEEPRISSFQAENGVVVTIQDLRKIHDTKDFRSKYAIKLSTRQGSIRSKKSRAPFDDDGRLRGYCGFAPQGTIIHPSAYLLLDEHIHVALDTKEARLQRQLEDWRETMLGKQNNAMNFGFWGDEENTNALEGGAIRVLVVGNTGVGKSTLINRTFGVNVTQQSHRSRGIHDVREEITWEGRPDLIVHDSGGFEAGTDAEFRAIEDFLKEKSAVTEVHDRVHVIWFCIEINSSRTMQTSTEKLFRACSMYAAEVPIVVVATKKDDLLDLEYAKRRKELKKQGQPVDDEEIEKYAEDQLSARLEQIREEMTTVPDGRFDALVAVSQDDGASISELSKTTSLTFDIDKVRLLYIRAQVTRIDLKIDMALHEVMRRYRALIRTATATSLIAAAGSIHRHAASVRVCHAIVGSFGIPNVTASQALDALKTSVWDGIGFDPGVALAEMWNLFGLVGTGFAVGMPIFLITGGMTVPIIVPATARLFLMMANDLILVLVRSFREVTFRRGEGQPSEKDISAAARIYRVKGYTNHVHRDLKRLIPRKNLAASYKYDKIRKRVEELIENYKDKLMNDESLPNDQRKSKVKKASLSLRRKLTLSTKKSNDNDNNTTDTSSAQNLFREDTSSINSSIRDLNSLSHDSSDEDSGDDEAERDFYAQLSEAHRRTVELEANETAAVELPAFQTDSVELEGDTIRKTLPELEATEKVHELPG